MAPRLISLVVVAAMLLAACTASTQTREASVEQVSFQSTGATLGATLHLPAGRPSFPAVVLVHGSGPMTAAEIGRNAPSLLGMGYAVLAYDKRGVGRSTGQYTGIGPGNSVEMFDLLAADALAAVDMLRARPDIDARRVGLLGISQGGWIAPLAASRGGDRVAFVVVLSGPAVTVGEEIAYSRLAGADPGSQQGLSEEEIDARYAEFKGPYGYDPIPVIERLHVRSLWILGERDRSLPVKQTIAALHRIRDTGRPITTQVIPGADHSLRDATGQRAQFWPAIHQWLTK